LKSVRRSLKPALGRQVNFGADDGLDTRFFAGAIKLYRAEKVPVVGDRQRRHTQLFSQRRQIVYATDRVQETVLRVNVQMDKIGAHLIKSASREQAGS